MSSYKKYRYPIHLHHRPTCQRSERQIIMTAFLPVLPILPRPTYAPLLICHSRQLPVASATVDAPRRRRPRHHDIQPSTQLPSYAVDSVPLPQLPKLQPHTLPDELSSHDLLSTTEERNLLNHVKFLRQIDSVTETLYLKHQEKNHGNTANLNFSVSALSIATYMNMTEFDLERRRRFSVKARNQLVTYNVRLVSSIAAIVHRSNCRQRHSSTSSNMPGESYYGKGCLESSGITVPDLVQEGCIALIRAAECFNLDQGVRFTTYASRAIYSACLRAAVPANCIVTLPERLRRAAQRPNATFSESEYLPDHLVSLARVHLKSGVSLDEKIQSSQINQNSTDRMVSRGDLLACERAQPQVAVERDIFNIELRMICYEVLTERQADLVVLRFGLNGQNPMKTKEIASLYGRSVSRIGQLLSFARNTLRERAPHLHENWEDSM